MKEIWRTLDNYPEIEVSNIGRIRLIIDRPNGRYPWAKGVHGKGFIFSPTTKLGYQTVRLTREGKRKQLCVSRLVCEAFHGSPPSPTHHAAHKNGDKNNNSESNLYWATPQQNIMDREKHGTTSKGNAHYFSKLKSTDIPIIRKMLADRIPQTEIAKKFGVTNYAIHDIKRGKSWKHV